MTFLKTTLQNLKHMQITLNKLPMNAVNTDLIMVN